MTFRQLNAEEITDIINIHMNRDFPADELRPEWTFRNMIEEGSCRFYGLFDGEVLVAYGNIVNGVVSNLLDYFAVVPEFRCRGIGTIALSELMKVCDGLILEVENPDYATDIKTEKLRRRRIEFYKRMGAVESGISGRALGVEYLVLFIGKRRDFARLGIELRELYRTLYPGLDVEKAVNYA